MVCKIIDIGKNREYFFDDYLIDTESTDAGLRSVRDPICINKGIPRVIARVPFFLCVGLTLYLRYIKIK